LAWTLPGDEGLNKDTKAGFNWTGLSVIATVARLLFRELTLQIEYVRAENKILKSKTKGHIRFTDDDRRSLVDAALAMGRKVITSTTTSSRISRAAP